MDFTVPKDMDLDIYKGWDLGLFEMNDKIK